MQNRTEQNKTLLDIERPKIKQATQLGYIECDLYGVFDSSYPTSKFRRGRVQNNGQVSPTLMTGDTAIMRIEPNIYKDKEAMEENKTDEPKYRIRKLTPKERYRLMNVRDCDADKMLSVNSNTQCYKQAGNSIVVACLCAIFTQFNIKGVKAWNNMTNEERYALIENGCR